MVSVDAKHDVYFNTPSPSLISLVVSVDVKHHVYLEHLFKAQELCESRGGRPGLPDPIKPCGLCGCKVTLN